MFKALSRLLIGQPLSNEQVEGEQIPKWKALPIFSSDALSSVGYGPEQVALVLVAIPSLELYSYLGAVIIAIMLLLAIVVLSYTQVIRANPGGGGSYGIAMKYLGVYPALLAGAALFTDYILTVAVSLSSGTEALFSAFPALGPYHIEIDLVVLLVMMIVNLRGVREASTVFVWPTYLFVTAMFMTILGGLYQIVILQVPPVTVAANTTEPLSALTLLVILRAFANGCSSMTGVEAIANGVTAFKQPQESNAIKTTVMMALILGTMLGGTGYLISYFHLLPAEGVTLMSVLVENVFGRGILFYFVQIMMMAILYLAANTAYNGLPPLLSYMAQDGYVPRYLGNKGERLSFSNGIVLLTIAAAMLILIFNGNVEHLISLYAIGVFLSFTIAQTAMVVHWRRSKEEHWLIHACINGFGAVVTFFVVIIILVTKFMYGAWIIVLLIPMLMRMFVSIHRHYENVCTQLILKPQDYINGRDAAQGRNFIIVPVASPTQAVAKAIQYAKLIRNEQDTVYAVHVCMDEEKGKEVKALWEELEPDIRIVLIASPYRKLSDPLLRFIIRLKQRLAREDTITVLIPEFETKKLWHRFLHNQSGWILRARMLNYLDVVVTTVPLHFSK